MPPGSRTPPILRPARNRRKWRRRIASIRQRQKVARIRLIIRAQDPAQADRSDKLHKERREAKAKRRSKRAA